MGPSEAPSPAATILWRLRRPGHERQLTDCLGDLARVDGAIATGLAASLLDAAAVHGHGVRAAARARDLLAALPQDLTCSREETTGKLLVRERSWWRKEQARSGRLDWVFHPPGQERTKRDFQLAVEVKIGAGLTRHQLANYREHLARKRGGPRGLVVLARSFPDRGLLDDAVDQWLGVALWEQVLPALRGVHPSDQALAVQWPLLLDTLETREDLGTEPVTWASVTATDPGQAMRRLGEHVRHRAELRARTALARRAAGAPASKPLGVIALRTPNRREVLLPLRISPGDRSPAAEIRLRATTDGIALTSVVYPLRRPLAGKAKQRYDESLRRLTTRRLTPQYAAASRGYSRERLIKADAGDVRTAAAAAADDELRHIVRSGILDDDVRYAF